MIIRYLLHHAYGVGGTITTTLTNASNLAARGHDVEIVSVFRTKDVPKFPVDPRVRITTLVDRRKASNALDKAERAFDKLPSTLVPADERRFNDYCALTDQRLEAYLESISDGIVVGTRPALNVLMTRFVLSSVIRIGQEHLSLKRHRDKGRASQLAAMAAAYPQLDALVTLTQTDADDYRGFLGAKARVETIPNAVRGMEAADVLSTTDNPVIIAAGRLTAQKGFDRLIDAFSRIEGDFPQWSVLIYGGGVKKTQLRQRIADREMGTRIKMPGFISTLSDAMRAASVFAMPSRYEGFPMVLLEAMGVGLPAVVFDFKTGARDLVSTGVNGVLVAEGDVAGFADGLARLMSNAHERRRMGAQARVVAQGFAPDGITQRWEKLFRDAAR